MPTSGKKHNPIYQAQAILARRDHAESEVRQKLARKGFNAMQIEEAISWLYEKQLLDDTRFAEVYSKQLVEAKPVGPNWVKAKLRLRGLAQQDIESAIEHTFNMYPEDDLVQRAVESWKQSHTEDKNNKAALWRFLASRGFSSHVITESLEAD